MFARVGELASRFRWPIVGFWVVAAVLLNLALPPLEKVIAADATPFIPPDSPALQAFQTMGEKFSGATGGGDAVVAIDDPRGLSAADLAYYGRLAGRFRASSSRVAFVQDFAGHPELKASFVSRDGQVAYMVVGLHAPVGTPPGNDDTVWLRGQTAAGRPAGVTAYVTGDTPVIADFEESIQNSTTRTTLITGVLVVLILLLIYRSPVTPLIPLTTIGLSILVARPLVALLGLHLVKVAAFTETFLVAIVFGAGTDYCIFMISRFKEQMAAGDAPPVAVRTSVQRVGEAITSSAGTVIAGGVAMSTASVALFSTVGPAIAVAVAVTVLAGVTLTPALIAIAPNRFFWPGRLRADRVSRFWSRAADLIAARPRRVLAGALLPMLALAAFYPAMRWTYDSRSPQPQSDQSIQGLRLLGAHFGPSEAEPEYVLLVAGHDLRNPRDLTVLDRVTGALARLPGVRSVHSFTRPGGTTIPQASLDTQLTQVGGQLGKAQSQIGPGPGLLQQGAEQAVAATDPLLAGMQRESAGLGAAGGGASAGQAGAVQLQQGAAQLATSLDAAYQATLPAVAGLAEVISTLSGDPVCSADPKCAQSLQGLQQIYQGENGRLLPGLQEAAGAAHQIAAGAGSLSAGLARLSSGLAQAQTGMAQLQQGELTFQTQLGKLAGGAGRLNAGTQQLSSGLAQASAYLTGAGQDAAAAGFDTFYLPGSNLDDPRLALARYYYLSPDGTAARIAVYGAGDPFGLAAMDRVQAERTAAQGALAGTDLAGAKVQVAGFAAMDDNIRSLFQRDFAVVAAAVLIGVFIVLVLLLRSLVAPVYLLASVVLSYAAAMGLTTLVWQVGLGRQELDWSVPIFAFVMLVAVGADYNIFLMSRLREEVLRGPQHAVSRAVRRTGGIITSAGIIFAGTFAALMTSPVTNIAEVGFAITCGLILDTFLVRSFIVPATATLFGPWSWWPYWGVAREQATALRSPAPVEDPGPRPQRQAAPTPG